MSGTADPLSSEFDIRINVGTETEPVWETYTFRKPGIRYAIELGYRAAEVRRGAYPAAGGALDFAVDYNATEFARRCAILELYLVKADVTPPWTHAPGPDGKPVVDFDKFPADREDTIFQLGEKFASEVARFRTRGNPGQPRPGTQAVAGQPDS